MADDTNTRWAHNAPCPMYTDGRFCTRPYERGVNCKTFQCSDCKRFVPFCFGNSDDDLCNDCWALKHYVTHKPETF